MGERIPGAAWLWVIIFSPVRVRLERSRFAVEACQRSTDGFNLPPSSRSVSYRIYL